MAVRHSRYQWLQILPDGEGTVIIRGTITVYGLEE